ncbi:hypothetical protein GCM10023187_52920 [Nibrella viscosa]|uniref:Caspase family p20 domain-containing protein n=2 Tax=Nibrella viscosa TaxID=1084524 RepID=A0ABP8KZ60_9BACT
MRFLLLAYGLWLSQLGLAQSRSIKIVGGQVPSGTERRLALVIGNKDYRHVRALKNPLNDAQDMSNALEQIGFEVITLTNTTFGQMIAGLNRFKDKLTTSDVALLYYSGHGVSYNGRNYLMPIDAELRCLEQIEENSVSLNRVLADIAARQVRNSFVFLDACRNLPDLSICNGTQKDVTLQTGLVRPTNNPRGSMIVFATEEGNTADDNVNGRNGLFTEALLKYLTKPNLSIRAILDQTDLEAEAKSGGRQSPARYDKIRGEFMFVIQTPADPLPVTPAPSNAESVTRSEPARRQNQTKPIASGKPTLTPTRLTNYLDLPFADLVYVPGGSFQMGDTRNEGSGNETPDHRVIVSSFMMGKYEVTQRQWEAVMGNNPAYFKDCPDCPVESVSWEEVQEFLRKLNIRTNMRYRLPTEAEWEYAAGGGDVANRSRFGNGQDTLDPSQVNFDGNGQYITPYSVSGKYRNKTVEVGSLEPNQLGLYNMSGSVWEWCQDWYGDYSSAEQTNPTGPATGSYRVLRGGSWFTEPQRCRSSYRGRNTPESRFNYVGLRIVLSIP